MSGNERMDPPPSSEHQQVRELVSAAAGLKQEISKLNYDSVDTVTKLGTYTKKTRKMAWALVISVAIDIVLTLFITSNAISINHLTARLDYAQTVNRQRALCPLYQLFLDSKSEVGRSRAPDPVKYDQAFVVIQDGFDALKCTEFINKPVPPFQK